MLTEIRKRLKALPFEPFVLHLADRRKLIVHHPEFLWLPGPGVLHYLHQAPGGDELINPLLIVSISKHIPKSAKKS